MSGAGELLQRCCIEVVARDDERWKVKVKEKEEGRNNL